MIAAPASATGITVAGPAIIRGGGGARAASGAPARGFRYPVAMIPRSAVMGASARVAAVRTGSRIRRRSAGSVSTRVCPGRAR